MGMSRNGPRPVAAWPRRRARTRQMREVETGSHHLTSQVCRLRLGHIFERAIWLLAAAGSAKPVL